MFDLFDLFDLTWFVSFGLNELPQNWYSGFAVPTPGLGSDASGARYQNQAKLDTTPGGRLRNKDAWWKTDFFPNPSSLIDFSIKNGPGMF